MTTLEHEGYVGTIEIDEELGILYGRVSGIRDVIHYEGETVHELKKAFADSVEDYLELCKERGKRPEKPFSGKLPLRITPELHKEIFTAATARGRV